MTDIKKRKKLAAKGGPDYSYPGSRITIIGWGTSKQKERLFQNICKKLGKQDRQREKEGE